LGLARAPRILGPLRRATCAAVVGLLKKSIFDLRIDAMEPLLSALGSLLIGGDFRFHPPSRAHTIKLKGVSVNKRKLSRAQDFTLWSISDIFYGGWGHERRNHFPRHHGRSRVGAI
jgi:hypothetical protein